MDPVLDSYAAKTCTYALHLNVVEDHERRLGFSDVAMNRINRGIAFEEAIGKRIVDLAGEGELAELNRDTDREVDEQRWSTDRKRRLEQTMEALREGVPVVWNPRLETDLEGHRSGEPDLLVRVRTDMGTKRYVPVDVKAHHALVARSRADSAEDLSSLFTNRAVFERVGPEQSSHREDLMQLAHYWRMLESLGYAPSESPYGAIIGSPVDERELGALVWFNLGPIMDEYDTAFAHALEVVRRAAEIASGSNTEPLGAAWYTRDCHECGWRAVCGPLMMQRSHVSLVRPNKHIWDELEELGISTIDELALLDEAIEREDGRTVGESAYWRDSIRRAQLARAGDPVPLSLLPEIAGEGPLTPRLWRRENLPADCWALPAGDIELDVDMECTTSHVYLWGTLLHYDDASLSDDGPPAGYVGFGSDFPTPIDEAETAIFLSFWYYLQELLGRCSDRGLTFRAYCYSDAENRWMRRCADLIDATRSLDHPRLRAEVDAFISSPAWVDLYKEMRVRLESLNGLGLKTVAKALGFAWRAKDAGGEASMMWYEDAVTAEDAAERGAWQRQILDYNEDDVRATRFLRTWFASHGHHALPLVKP